MTDFDALIGKTIAAAEFGAYESEWLIEFTDGSAVMLQPEGYEAESIGLSDLSPERLAELRAEKVEREREDAERAAEAKAKHAEVERMREALPSGEFEAWMDEHRPGWRELKVLQDVWREAFSRQVYGSSPLLETFGRRAVIPTFKSYEIRIDPGVLPPDDS